MEIERVEKLHFNDIMFFNFTVVYARMKSRRVQDDFIFDVRHTG